MAKLTGFFQSERSLKAREAGREKGVYGEECIHEERRQLQATQLFTRMLQEKREEGAPGELCNLKLIPCRE